MVSPRTQRARRAVARAEAGTPGGVESSSRFARSGHRPDPNGKHGHLAAPGERGRSPEGNCQDGGKGQTHEERGAADLGIPLGCRHETGKHQKTCRRSCPEESFGKRASERGRDPSHSAESRKKAGDRAGKRFPHPGCRPCGLSQQDRDPEDKRGCAHKQSGRRLPPSFDERHGEKRAHGEEAEIVRVQRQGGQRRGREQSQRCRPDPGDEQEEAQSEEGQQGIGSGLGCVEEKQGRGGAEKQQASVGDRRQPASRGKKQEDRQIRRCPRETVRQAKRLREEDERLFEEIEKRRPGIVTQDRKQRPWGKPRCPEGKRLVVPEGARRENPEAASQGQRDGAENGRRPEARRVVSLSCDDLS